MTVILWRVLIAIVCCILAYALIPPVCRVIGFALSEDVLTILRICIGGIALLYIIRGWPGAPAPPLT